MKLIELTPMLWTNDVKATINFYVNELGFTCHEYSEVWGWAAVGKDNAGLMFAKPNEHTSYDGPKFSGSFYFRTDDADALWDLWKDKHKIAYELDNFEHGMREFAIYDNNGYMLQFGQEIIVQDE